METLSICPENELRLLYQHGNAEMCLSVEEAVARLRVPTLRVWTTSRCVVVGRFQETEKEVDVGFCRENSITVLRRFTGGGAVFLDDGVLCISFCLPLAESPLDVFHALSACVARTLGAEIDEKNNLFVEGKKVSGAAGCRKWGSLFHHMTVLVDCNLDSMNALTRAHEGRTASTPHEVGNVGWNMKAVILDVTRGFQEEFDITLKPGKLLPEEVTLTDRLMKQKYSRGEWNFLGIDPVP